MLPATAWIWTATFWRSPMYDCHGKTDSRNDSVADGVLLLSGAGTPATNGSLGTSDTPTVGQAVRHSHIVVMNPGTHSLVLEMLELPRQPLGITVPQQTVRHREEALVLLANVLPHQCKIIAGIFGELEGPVLFDRG